jgi:RNA polymerase sigma-70 factor, ECF subfamily
MFPVMKPDVPLGPSKPAMKLPPEIRPEALRMADERRLIARAQAGDTVAFRDLVERHQSRAYTLALRILRSAADAEEVAQDAFVRVWTALPSFRGESSFATWLYRIVARRAFDRAEVLKNRRAREQTEARLPEHEAPAAADEDALQAALLQRLVGGLTPAQRSAVTLFYYEGRSVEQVAALLGMPENTVKTHLLRARAALRAVWTHETGEQA